MSKHSIVAGAVVWSVLGIDRAMFCDGERRECVLGCADEPCPSGWSCNDDDEPWCEPGECRVPG